MIINKILRAHQLPLAILVDLIIRHPLALHPGPLAHFLLPCIEVVGTNEIVLVDAKQ